MADKYLNYTALSYYHNRIKALFASQTALNDLEEKVDDIIAEGGEPNVIEEVKVNGTALVPDVNKAVDVTVPTKTSDLTNDGSDASASPADPFATQSYVDENGGKIDVIKVNGTAQTITNKEVDLAIQEFNVIEYGRTTYSEASGFLTGDALKPILFKYAGRYITAISIEFSGEQSPFDIVISANTVVSENILIPESTVITARFILTPNDTWENDTTEKIIPAAVSELTNDGDGTSPFATEAYVGQNGGKIDVIKVNGTAQTITNKEVDLAIQEFNVIEYNTSTFMDVNALLLNQHDKPILLDISNSRFFVTGIQPVGSPTTSIEIYFNVANNGSVVATTKATVDQSDTWAITSITSTIPTAVSDLTNDSGYQTASDVSTAISAAVASAYKYKGSVATYADLPSSGQTAGDVYDVQADGMNYAWTGTAWDALGTYVDMSLYWAKSELVAITTAEIDAIIDAA